VTVGFIGLGNMGAALAANLSAAGESLVVADLAGPARAPAGSVFVADVGVVAAQCEVVVCSLPDGKASATVVRGLLAGGDHIVEAVIDTSTTGPRAARVISDELEMEGIAYVDAPVSGGVAGARARTLAVMYSGTDAACSRVEPVLEGLSDNRKRVGNRAGLAQAMKLVNNFLAATAMAATSEAIAFGMEAGLEMATMLDVLNTSSGHNTATDEKFPNHVLTERYASGFSNLLMAKDVGLYIGEMREAGGPVDIGEAVDVLWRRFAAEEAGADFTRIFPFVRAEFDSRGESIT
jgi:3-hydroxyisobutyrate dehydrogenase-like beta-hydroxyacid dehydrogenase